MSITIYHNPSCGTSRNTLAMIRQSGVEPTIIEYLQTPPTRARLVELAAAMQLPLRSLLREKGTPYKELGLDDEGLSDDALLDAMTAHPVLINRPIVVTDKGTRLCRPSEQVLYILPNPHIGRFVKETARSSMSPDLPNILSTAFQVPAFDHKATAAVSHKPRILLLYGSVRERSFSRFAVEETARLLAAFGAETRIFNPSGLPLPDDAPVDHAKVSELRDLSAWSEGQVWCSPERHGAMTAIMKAQVDWIPLSIGAVRPTQGKTLAVMQVSGGSQSFNAVNQLRVLGRWMRMITIPNQSSVARAYEQFDEAGRMKPSAYYDRIVDVAEELVKFTLLTRGHSAYLTDRYSERKEHAAVLHDRLNLQKAT